MADARAWVRRLAFGAATTVLVVAVYPVISEFLVELAREWGWYDRPRQRVAEVSACLVALAASPWFHWIGGGVVGFAAGAWLDVLLRRRQGPIKPRFSTGLYVGNMQVDAQHLNEEMHLTITISGLNSTGEAIAINRVLGSISCRAEVNGVWTEMEQLPQAVLLHEGLPDTFADRREVSVVLRQHLLRATADRMSSVLADGASIYLEFGACDVIAQAAAAPERTARLPLWDAVALTKRSDAIAVARVIDVFATIGVGVDVRSGG
jgi:hypothetical protein